MKPVIQIHSKENMSNITSLWDGRRQKNLAEAEAILAESQAKGQAEIIKAQAELERVKAENRKAMLTNLGKIGFLIVLAVIAIIILK